MELKEFIKGVVADVTNAIKECQEELDNGAIVSPTNRESNDTIDTDNGKLQISEIEFEVSVSASSSNESGGKINVLSAIINGGVNCENNNSNENVSKVKFSIPVIYPTCEVKERKKKNAIDKLGRYR